MGADALGDHDEPIELKSTTKEGVTTARDVGPHTLTKWREKYWIVGKGHQVGEKFEFEEIYFLSPSMLEEWLGTLEAWFRDNLRILDQVKELLRNSKVSEEDQTRLAYLVERGMTKNNPKIFMQYVREHGVRIGRDHARSLRTLIEQNPLGR